ncbi:MAG: hypothetical protein Q9221_007383 [Calogaya cf. arnoldii]
MIRQRFGFQPFTCGENTAIFSYEPEEDFASEISDISDVGSNERKEERTTQKERSIVLGRDKRLQRPEQETLGIMILNRLMLGRSERMYAMRLIRDFMDEATRRLFSELVFRAPMRWRPLGGGVFLRKAFIATETEQAEVSQ